MAVAIYLLRRCREQIQQFISDWYIGSFLFLSRTTTDALERVDRIFAVRVTAKNFFKPLYQDYSIMGRILGLVFRTARILGGGLTVSSIVLLGLVLYLAFALLPFAILYYGFFHNI